jgi:hypothetical protein
MGQLYAFTQVRVAWQKDACRNRASQRACARFKSSRKLHKALLLD